MKVFLSISALFLLASGVVATGEDTIDIGSRRELFVDRQLVGEMNGDAHLQLHKPQAQEVVLVTDKPWEGNTCAYYTIFQDGDMYRMYYRGSHAERVGGKSSHLQVACYAESKDGIHWTKPELGLFEFNGSKKNNIIWDGVGTHNFTPFKDDNPDCDSEQRYKALGRGGGEYPHGLYAFASADGVRWKLMQDKPVITEGAFDSQNLAFWDPHAGLYREYHRGFRNRVRDILGGTSKDFVTWTKPKYLDYPDAPNEHLYTNAIRSYERAPHLLIGFPTRYAPKTQQVEPIFMTSRDGQTFHRWDEAVIGIDAPEDRDQNRSNYMTWGLVQLPNKPQELSVYATEAYYSGPDSRVRRFTYRVDGFVSLQAGEGGGELITKPIVFAGDTLRLNYKTTDGGTVRVELQDAAGKPLDGFALADCKSLSGDELDAAVGFAGGTFSSLAGKPVRVRFVLNRADVYSYQFDAMH